MADTPANEPAKMSDNQILVALITFAEMLVLGGIAIGYFMTRAAIWIHVGVGVLILAGAAIVYLSWKDTKTQKGGDNA